MGTHIIEQPLGVAAWKSAAFWKNEARMRLLALLPPFQDEVLEIRKGFGIPQNGFTNAFESQKWHDKLYKKSEDIAYGRDFSLKLKKLKRKLTQKTITYPEYIKQENALKSIVLLTDFNNRIKQLASRFHLPYNFVDSPLYGLRLFVLRNVIAPPHHNYVIEPDPETRKGTGRWVSIKIYAPLDKTEMKEAIDRLKRSQSHDLPKELKVSFRIRKQFERDLRLLEELSIKITSRPVKRKQYEKGSYLSYIKKDISISTKERRRLERLHPKDIFVDYDQPTSRRVAKKEKMASDAARKAIERLRKNIKQFFGINIMTDDKRNT